MANPSSPMKNRSQEEATPFTERGREAAGSIAEKGKEAAATVLEKAKDAASAAAGTAGNVASYVGHKADDATAAVGKGMETLAGKIRDNLPDTGMIGKASSAVANTLESGGRYLERQGLSGIGEDLTNLVRRNPIPSVLVGIALGFLVARAMQRS